MNQRGLTAEDAVIGSILVDAKYSIPKVEHVLTAAHFEDPLLGEVFTQVVDLFRKGEPVDVLVASDRFRPEERSVLLEICHNFPGIMNLDHYRDMVIKNYHSRKMKDHFKKGLTEPLDEDLFKSIQNEWRGVTSLGAKKFDLSEKIAGYTDLLEKRAAGKEQTYPTGFPTLDYKIPLLKQGELCIVAARTSLGKTSLMLEMMMKMARSKLRVVYCSGEMSFNQLMDRVLSVQANIPLLNLRKGSIDGAGWPRIVSVLGEIAELPIRVVEASKLSFDRIMPHIIEFNADVVFIDYIQRFNADGKQDSRAAFYSDVANTLKGISVERNIGIVAASQLGRDVEKRKDEPRLSDLKESGGIEEAADVVWALHTETAKESFAGMVDYRMLILKNRNGPTFSFDAVFDCNRAVFFEKEI